MSSRPVRSTNPWVMLLGGLFIVIVTTLGISSMSTAAQLKADARAARVALAVDAARADQEFFAKVARQAALETSRKVQARRAEDLADLSAVASAAQAVIASSEAKVMDNGTRLRLQGAVDAANTIVTENRFLDVTDAAAQITALSAEVAASQAAWQTAEDARVAAEREARLRAERVQTTEESPWGGTSAAPAVSGTKALNTGRCLGSGGSGAEVQRVIDGGCTSVVTYGPAPWLAAHDYLAGDSWKAMADGEQFTYNGATYQVTGRNSIHYEPGTVVPLDPLVHGDLTLQTCIGNGHIVFIHASVVG